ncbi:efflux RND transporter periplasmic adaptor subunit [Mesobacillus maritimus]|uniref:efflux RND transporter periplasmic adaptor subunit n=1 Tax=Mesobacillus maritimus TaxID=1643336 RepID=UPI0020425492|nr:efflux RND transporter periplasmic adaptor subunit [Mesobacillus maritimus]MCM3585283.1 efflux RND transporter periplasmic adaptor subunit [Mesobacillus maritimus]MCM3668170.1 efflux RND transporter periplasmic adaptor subunit [Mesobacillus maritimus]
MKKILLSATAVLMLSTLAACSGADSDSTDASEEKRIAAVEVEEATKGDFTLERSLFGRTAPNQTTPILLQAPGEIDSLEVSNGDEVEEDEIIAKIKTQVGTQNIRAPKDGEIANLAASEGSTVSNEEPFAIVADLETIKVNFTVTADVRNLFEVDKKMTATINNKEYEASISSISTMPDDSGLYPVEAIVENEEKEILPGMVAELAVPEKRLKDAVIIPTASIVEEDDETYVYIVEDNLARKQAVTVVETQSVESAIKGEVKQGDQLVVTGQLTLSDGVQVNVVKGESK